MTPQQLNYKIQPFYVADIYDLYHGLWSITLGSDKGPLPNGANKMKLYAGDLEFGNHKLYYGHRQTWGWSRDKTFFIYYNFVTDREATDDMKGDVLYMIDMVSCEVYRVHIKDFITMRCDASGTSFKVLTGRWRHNEQRVEGAVCYEVKLPERRHKNTGTLWRIDNDTKIEIRQLPAVDMELISSLMGREGSDTDFTVPAEKSITKEAQRDMDPGDYCEHIEATNAKTLHKSRPVVNTMEKQGQKQNGNETLVYLSNRWTLFCAVLVGALAIVLLVAFTAILLTAETWSSSYTVAAIYGGVCVAAAGWGAIVLMRRARLSNVPQLVIGPRSVKIRAFKKATYTELPYSVVQRFVARRTVDRHGNINYWSEARLLPTATETQRKVANIESTHLSMDVYSLTELLNSAVARSRQ